MGVEATMDASLFLNLVSTFLYMTNYYVVGPSSPSYIQQLGGHEALSGLLIGATPFAAMFSALLYSIWTNTSFREPLIFSGGMLLVGNLLYGLALECDCLAFLFIGRFMIGLGGTRGIGRRYIADTVSLQERTRVSSYFVAFGACGMAFGPMMAVYLASFDVIIQLPILGEGWGFVFNGLTGPGE